MQSLWGEEFNIDKKQKTKEVLDKLKSPKTPKVSIEKNLKSKKISIEDKLNIIYENVEKILGTYKKQTIIIKTLDELNSYINVSKNNNIIAIDTETNNSLDPITCKLMGVCIYTPTLDAAYIPINHTTLEGIRLEWQLTEKDIFEQFTLLNNTKILTHNGKFDYEVLKCTTNWEMPIYWDTMIGARLLNENERAGLKQQYIEKIDSSIEKYSIESLFENIDYAIVKPEIFALYAATDSFMTYKLYEWQLKEFEKTDNEKLFNLFKTVEMPIVTISAKMELEGICIDKEYSKRLSQKYNQNLIEIQEKINNELNNYKNLITKWRLTKEANEHKIVNGKEQKSKNEQLKDPIELTSPTQLAILLYDILKVPVIDKKTPRGTGAEILKQIDLPICNLLIEQKTILKLLTAFIDTLPNKINEKDKRLHSHFNQLGTDTGRFSSTEPNLQQIPSKNKEIRMMFCAKPGFTLVGADFSAQEPRILAAYSKDEKMLDAFKNEKDIYATVGSGIFKNNYWDNMEYHEDGTPNVEGKKRRSMCKKVILGTMYGMGSKLMAENMGVSIEEGKKIIEGFFKGFPKVHAWIEDTEKNACITGYVEDFAGRKRHLPDLLLPEYTIENNNKIFKFNPLLNTEGFFNDNDNLINKYKEKLKTASFSSDKQKIKEQALQDNIKIMFNDIVISKSKRQCVNARVQGGAATMTKKAMIAIDRDKEMNNLGFKLLIGVHDELIGECPKENAEKVSERLTFLMSNCVPELSVKFKCDAEIEDHWYKNEYSKMLNDEKEKLLKNKLNLQEIYDILYKNHIECTKEQLMEYLDEYK